MDCIELVGTRYRYRYCLSSQCLSNIKFVANNFFLFIFLASHEIAPFFNEIFVSFVCFFSRVRVCARVTFAFFLGNTPITTVNLPCFFFLISMFRNIHIIIEYRQTKTKNPINFRCWWQWNTSLISVFVYIYINTYLSWYCGGDGYGLNICMWKWCVFKYSFFFLRES